MKVWVKICGITRVEDARAAVDSGADALGVNFCESSVRYCDSETARELVAAVDARVPVYGVFVGAPRDEIASAMAHTGITGIQLHGGEEASLAQGWPVPVIRAIIVDDAERVRKAIRERGEERILLDSPRGGGSGTRFDEEMLRGTALAEVIVAGGLDPGNVAQVVRRLRPWGVDTASGVESSAGVKDDRLLKEFIDNARSA